MTATPRRDVVLTGATGFLGHYLLAELLRVPGIRCRLMLRSPIEARRLKLVGLMRELGFDLESLIQEDRVVLIEGTLPDSVDPASLRGAEAIIHAAASTRFEADAHGEPHRSNVMGTHMLLNAATAACVRRFALISTAYVCGENTGNIAETITSSPPKFNNAYEASKYEAEQLTREWATGRHVATICRPAILFGDSQTGRTTNYGGIYLIARATEILRRAMGQRSARDRYAVPLRIVGDPDATSNLVPVDLAARRIIRCCLDDGASGRVHHITNGIPPTHAEIKRWLEEYFDVGGGVFSRESWPLPKPSHYEELFYSRGSVVSNYFRSNLYFEARWHGPHSRSPRMVTKQDFFRALRYAQEHRWGRQRPGKTVDASTAIDPAWYFQEFLGRSLPQSSVADVNALTANIGFRVGTSPRRWTCRFDRGVLVHVEATRNGAPSDFSYWVSMETFPDIVTGRDTLQAAFFRGDIEVTGNVEQALRMVPIMTKFIEEFPVHHAG